MRRIQSIGVALLWFAGAFLTLAQTPTPIPVTGNLGSISGLSQPYAGIQIQLQNCASPVRITGFMGIVQQTYQIQASPNGLINSTVWPNDLIDCNGTTGNSQYNVVQMVQGIPSGTAQCYQVTSTQGIWNFNTQQPVACGQTPPAPGDATYNNVVITGFLQGNNADFTGQVEVGSILVDAGRTNCTTGQFMTGLTAYLQPNCSTPAAAPVSSVFGRTGIVAAASGDYNCAQVTGAICSLPTLFYQTVKQDSTTMTQAAILHFISGSGVAVSCANGSGSTDCTFSSTALTGCHTFTSYNGNTAARNGNTVYQNTTGCELDVYGALSITTAGSTGTTYCKVGSTSSVVTAWQHSSGATPPSGDTGFICTSIPPNYYYEIVGDGAIGNTQVIWSESTHY